MGMAMLMAVSAGVMATSALVGGTLGVIGDIQQQRQAEANAKMQSQQFEYNRKLEEREADRIEQESAENARRQHEESERMKSRQRALLGKSGAAMTSGSPLAVLGQTAEDEERRKQDMLYGGYNEAQQRRNQATMLQYQSDVARAQAPSRAGLGLSIAGRAVDMFGQLGQTGMSYASGMGALNASGQGGKA